VVLLPARNAAEDLPGWFESVERFADAVVALDDGSTDATGDLLAAHPLVEVVLRNPRRETYEGWDDGANRAELLAAAESSAPQWVLSLDADERLAADDAEALRDFLAGDALPGVAYGLQCFRMWGDGCDPGFRWVYRLFLHQAGHRFPDGQLHFDPVPTALGPGQHVRTSLRIQHWGSHDDDRRAARIAKYEQADPRGRYPTGFGGVDEVPATVVPWAPRPPGTPTLVGARPVGRPEPTVAEAGRPRLVVLLPARNAAEDLPGWFESVERFADAVVALDDGSTDATGALLAAHPLVEVVLRNPRRETYEGWDDRENRARLLDAAADVDPDWVLFLDADERISPDDAAALRDFLDADALPGLAYGMRCLRMIGGLDHYDRDGLWVYRLFAFAPGLELPAERLHFVPVPTSIPRDRWVRTTLRIQHLAGLDGPRRRARHAKYREADRDTEFQAGYDHLLDEPGELRVFAPRPTDLPVVLPATERASGPDADAAIEAYDPEAPALSAVVISRDDEDRIERTVRSVVAQDCHEPFEVIVVTSGTDRTASIVRDRFPGVTVLELDHPALPGEARNAGLRLARGHYVSFPGSHVELPPGSLAARVRAHDDGWSMVTGTTRNGTDSRAGWAAYFLDHSTVLPGRPSQPLSAPPAHCSYERHRLVAIGGFPEDIRAGEDTWVNERLFRSGASAYRAADVPLVHHNRSRWPWQLARRHFARGRAQTQFLRGLEPGPAEEQRVRAYFAGYRSRRLARIDANVDRWGGELREEYRRARPLVRLGIAAAWLGGRAEQRRPTTRTGRASGDVTGGSRSALLAPLRVRSGSVAPWSEARPIFLHLPKTAGTTLLRILEREIAPRTVVRVYDEDGTSIAEVVESDAADRAAIAAVAGHMAIGIDRYLPGRNVYLTMLRDPVERIVSHYEFLRARPHLAKRTRALEGVRSLEDYVMASPWAPLINNGQARLLGGDVLDPGRPADEATLERALDAVGRPDVLVGLQDRFDESLLLFRRALGWGYPAYRRENRSGAAPRDELPESVVAMIRDRNALDLVLYRRARERFDADLAAAGDLTAELERQRLAGRWSGPG
jgi:glycosyltransferase involved in cell wall biosynthesis